MTHIECDVLVVGAGPGGLAAAKGAREAGADKVIVLERSSYAGGILDQCIHDGFGLIRYNETITGPQYARRALHEAEDSGAELRLGRHVTEISADKEVMAYTREGVELYNPKSIILATGCRERTRGAIAIPGGRPAGIYTAGVAQRLINCQNVMVGKRVVILGSGDIGLIMARRLTLEGAKVLAVAEIMPEPCGLARNISQCLYDYDIPIYVNTTVSEIMGKKRLEAVKLSTADENRRPIAGTERLIECDTLILSVGLIPENEVAQTCGIRLNPDGGTVTDKYLQTNVYGVFACGNSRRVCDLADFVSEQGELVGRNAVHLLTNKPMEKWDEARTNCMKKGFPEENTVTCNICPNGCQIRWDKESDSCSGNKCPRGIQFAKTEMTNPVRYVTTTVRVRDREKPLIPVRSAKPIPKNEVIEFVRRLKDSSINNKEICYEKES